MTIKEKIDIAKLIKYHFVIPIKETGNFGTDNAMFFAKEILEKFPCVAEILSMEETDSNEIAGSEFINELGIKI